MNLLLVSLLITHVIRMSSFLISSTMTLNFQHMLLYLKNSKIFSKGFCKNKYQTGTKLFRKYSHILGWKISISNLYLVNLSNLPIKLTCLATILMTLISLQKNRKSHKISSINNLLTHFKTSNSLISFINRSKSSILNLSFQNISNRDCLWDQQIIMLVSLLQSLIIQEMLAIREILLWDQCQDNLQ